jgi:hypothetical protein
MVILGIGGMLLGGYGMVAYYHTTFLPPPPKKGRTIGDRIKDEISHTCNNAHGVSILGGKQMGVDAGISRQILKFTSTRKR